MIFSIILDVNSTFYVECLIPLSKVHKEYPTYESFVVHGVYLAIVQYQFANLHVALEQDCLLANDSGTLGLACIRPQGHVTKDDLHS